VLIYVNMWMKLYLLIHYSFAFVSHILHNEYTFYINQINYKMLNYKKIEKDNKIFI